VASEIADFGLQLVDGLTQIQAERDANNDADVETPLVFPGDIAAMRSSHFVEQVREPRRIMIGRHWTLEQIESIECEQRELRSSYLSDDTSTKDKITTHTLETTFDTAWNDFSGQYLHLRQFVGGLATSFASTTAVEADFSIFANRTSMTHLTLEGIMQCKQSRLLASIVPKSPT
jgi:hypothetical protein